MTGQFFISLLSPAVTMLLSSAFLVLWFHQKRKPYLWVIGICFAACALAFFLHDIVPGEGFSPGKLLSNLFFLTAVLLACGAILMRAGLEVPIKAFGLISGAGTLGFLWFAFVDPRLDWRIYVVNIAYAATLMTTLMRLHAKGSTALIEKLIFGIVGFAMLNFAMRPALLLIEGRDYISYDGFQQSIYWSMVQFASAVMCLGFALIFLLAVALDLMGELKSEAITDKLSGLLNRRGFEDHGTAMINAYPGLPGTINLVLADLDHFKQINDTFGHAVGDQVIASFGQVLRELGGPDAIIGRVGGEEFAVLLADTTPAEAQTFAYAVRDRFAQATIPGVDPGTRFTASFGICPRDHGEGLPHMLKHADQALYLAKDSGRNRVHNAGRPTQPLILQGL